MNAFEFYDDWLSREEDPPIRKPEKEEPFVELGHFDNRADDFIETEVEQRIRRKG